jgi:hypothetical protein
MKPYVSEAQRRWAHTLTGKKALGGNAGVHEWDEATKGKKLPEKVAKKEVCLPKEDFVEEHKDLVNILKHPSKKKINREIKEQSKELKEETSKLEKGLLQNAGVALGMAGALAGSSAQAAPKAPTNRAPANIQQVKPSAPSYDHKKMLGAISQVESSGGKNINHKPLKNGEVAYGKYALLPNTIKDTIKAHKDLKAKYGKALALQGPQLHKFMQDNKGLEDVLANRHLAHMEHRLGSNPDMVSMAWLNGIQGTLDAKNKGTDIKNHQYVTKVRNAYGKGK